VQTQQWINTSRQYDKKSLQHANTQYYAHHITLVRNIPELGWRMHILLDKRTIQQSIRNTLIAAVSAYAFLCMVLFYFILRRRQHKEAMTAQRALKAAHMHLEEKVARRTTELQAANDQLTQEIQERQKAEKDLRAAQEDLVQAAKLAVIGQLAAGITHELNQPLAAMRVFADNAQRFLAAQKYAATQENLEHIIHLTDRMAKITQQLRAFAKKSPKEETSAHLQHTIDNAIMLLATTHKTMPVTLDLPTTPIFVMINSVRLEQVLVNLLRNALEAVQTDPQIHISADMNENSVTLTIQDNGPGIDPAILPMIFDPFFSSRTEGLGLGLAISLSIIRDAGGQLSAKNLPDGGVCMQIILRRETHASHAD
jgi:two-component system C4-dicarboxylate transport sensor histidine kinase DctB